jgi:lipid II:glycine glycyltransferase (peptidoglycan interpeptide bridge formation enzyme)
MLQCWQYGEAKEKSENWKAIRVVVSQHNLEIAIVQFLVKSIPFLGGVARMNRGPILIGDVDELKREGIILDIIHSIINFSKERKWWVIQLAPELSNTERVSTSLSGFGFRHLPAPPYESGLFSLNETKEQLLMKFNGKWRNCLRKGLKLNVNIKKSSGDSVKLSDLLKVYSKFQEDKKFTGLSNKLLHSLANISSDEWQFTLFTAYADDEIETSNAIGMLVCIRHGDTATYTIGYTDEYGRKLQANYVLLWNAILHSKSLGCDWFDIGGLNETTPKGVAHFKKGINSDLYQLSGEWRMFVFSFKNIFK